MNRRREDAHVLGREIAALDEQLVRLTRQLASGVVPEDAFTGARDGILADREALEGRRDAAHRDAVTRDQVSAMTL